MKRLSLCVILLGSFMVVALGQPVKPIPVYPGAKLVTEKEEGVEPECCEFFTTDSFEKVMSFYEKQLKTKPMDTKALVAAYPAMKQQLQALEQQMPPNVKLRGFVVGEVTMNASPNGIPSGKAPIVFELMGSPQGVRFSVSEEAMVGSDAHFAKEWREKTGKLTEEEKMKKESDMRQAGEDQEQKERDARRAKEEPQYFAKMTAELAKLLRQNKIDLAPGLQCETIDRQEGESSTAYAFYFTSADDFKKMYDFYASRTKPAPISNAQGNGAGWSKYDHVCFWRTAEFAFGDALQIQVLEMSLTMDGPKKTGVMMRVSSEEVQTKLQQIRQEYESRW